MPRYWLMKSEPDVYSIDDLKRDGQTFWEGVRNYQARNLLRDQIQVGDQVLFYHSSAKPPAVAGTAVVVAAARPDPAQFDPRSDYHDPKSTIETPRWFGVEIAYQSHLGRPVPLDELRATPALADMVLLQRSRLSVQPVTQAQWKTVTKLGAKKRG